VFCCYNVIARAAGPWRSTAKRIKSSAAGAQNKPASAGFLLLFLGLFSTINSTLKNPMESVMSRLAANDLKTRGIAAIETALQDHSEAIVSVRGKDRYVVMDLEQYQYLRACELEAALVEARADLAEGRAVKESVEAHVARLDSMA
jgi:hypothetical protein